MARRRKRKLPKVEGLVQVYEGAGDTSGVAPHNSVMVALDFDPLQLDRYKPGFAKISGTLRVERDRSNWKLIQEHFKKGRFTLVRIILNDHENTVTHIFENCVVVGMSDSMLEIFSEKYHEEDNSGEIGLPA